MSDLNIVHKASKLTEVSGRNTSGATLPHKATDQWKAIDWKRAEKEVIRLQRRIAKAQQEGKTNKVKCLQHLLTRSHYAHLIAVKKVSSSKGSKTPGVDGQLWRTPAQKWNAAQTIKKNINQYQYRAKPLRRIYIPKKNNKKRPLGIPTLMDRALQALHALTLEPIAETLADWNSYGFRRFRCTADAIEQCFNVLSRKVSPQWVLEADIKACFDGISHSWLLEHIPVDKHALNQWLKAGYIDQNKLFPTVEGTPQGGIISPILCNMALDGLEQWIKSSCPDGHKVHFVRYADDFIVTCENKELLETHIKPAIEEFLRPRGLQLSQEKTKITHITNGFDFLGQNIRKYPNGKLIIKPSKESVKGLLDKVRSIIGECRGCNAETLINRLTPVLRGWANYHRHIAAKSTFAYVDYQIYQAIGRWLRRSHRRKSWRWIRNKYYLRPTPSNGAIFTAKTKAKKRSQQTGKIPGNPSETKYVRLYKVASTKIVRRVKVRMTANPFDPEQTSYFAMRKKSKGVRENAKSWKQSRRDRPSLKA